MASSTALATKTIHDLFTATVTRTIFTSSGAPSSTARAAPQGGVFEHGNPTKYDPKNPIILFVIQAAIVLILTRILDYPLSKLRQPRVIAEVITGILLGPSVMGHIPGFTTTIFPSSSMPAFTLAATLGLVFFLFLVGLEVDLRYLFSNYRIAISVGTLGMAIPFGLGCGIAVGLYHQFREDSGLKPISFGVYMLFIGVATSITAFPVLCRILTSLHLLKTPVGVIVLSAGVANDVVGWILLALCVALVNTSTGLAALYIFLTAVGYTLFLAFVIRPAFLWILKRTNSLQNGPTQTVVALTVLLVLASAFFTGIIGIHPIFGAFMVGLICPHQGGFAVKLAEKLEDFVTVLFLPLYFALSGLSTNLGLLNSGITWAYVVGVIAVAFVGKVAGGTLAARSNGMLWRESFAVGCLMSCKGLVELIVLNIGLQAEILSTRTFTIFVLMALVTTFATTPLTTFVYPAWYQRKLERWRKGEIDWDGRPIPPSDGNSEDGVTAELKGATENVARRVLVYLRLDGLQSFFTLVSLLAEPPSSDEIAASPQIEMEKSVTARAATSTVSLAPRPHRPLSVHALRLIELTERNSSVMRVAELESFAVRDPIIKAFAAGARSREVFIAGQVSVVPLHAYAGAVVHRSEQVDSDLILVPWSETGGISEIPDISSTYDPLANPDYLNFVSGVFDQASYISPVAIWLDKALFTPISSDREDESFTISPIRSRDQHSHHHHHHQPQQLTRSLSRYSVRSIRSFHREFESVDHNPTTDRHRLIIRYSGTVDDLLAVRLGFQLARSRLIESVTVIDASHDIDGLSRSTSPTVTGKHDNDHVDHDGKQENLASMFESIRLNTTKGPMKDKLSFVTPAEIWEHAAGPPPSSPPPISSPSTKLQRSSTTGSTRGRPQSRQHAVDFHEACLAHGVSPAHDAGVDTIVIVGRNQEDPAGRYRRDESTGSSSARFDAMQVLGSGAVIFARVGRLRAERGRGDRGGDAVVDGGIENENREGANGNNRDGGGGVSILVVQDKRRR